MMRDYQRKQATAEEMMSAVVRRREVRGDLFVRAVSARVKP